MARVVRLLFSEDGRGQSKDRLTRVMNLSYSSSSAATSALEGGRDGTVSYDDTVATLVSVNGGAPSLAFVAVESLSVEGGKSAFAVGRGDFERGAVTVEGRILAFEPGAGGRWALGRPTPLRLRVTFSSAVALPFAAPLLLNEAGILALDEHGLPQRQPILAADAEVLAEAVWARLCERGGGGLDSAVEIRASTYGRLVPYCVKGGDGSAAIVPTGAAAALQSANDDAFAANFTHCATSGASAAWPSRT